MCHCWFHQNLHVIGNDVAATTHSCQRLRGTEQCQRSTRARAQVNVVVVAGRVGNSNDIFADRRIDMDSAHLLLNSYQLLRCHDLCQVIKWSSWASGRGNVPSYSMGFCVAMTMNGSGKRLVTPSMVI